MKPGFSAKNSSRYFHPAFNSAIFDGPFRIYFVQFHETYALKIYFYIQEEFKKKFPHYKDVVRENQQTLFVMIYPTQESFLRAFNDDPPAQSKLVGRVHLDRESVFGLVAPVMDIQIRQLMDELSDVFSQWEREKNAMASSVQTLIRWPEAGAL